MKRFLPILLAVVLIFSACSILQTREPAPPSPPTQPTITPTCAEPSTPTAQLLHDILPDLQGADDACELTLCGTAEYHGRTFAMIAISNVSNTLKLVEYKETDSGYELLATCEGWAFATPGYIPIVAQFNDLTVCWSYITKQRLVPDNDGNAANDVYIPTDYTHIRMTLANGETVDAPVPEASGDNRLFFTVLEGGSLPTGFVPLAGDEEVSEWATGNGSPATLTAVTYYNSAST